MEKISFNDLPEAISKLINKLSEIERLLEEKNGQPTKEVDVWFDLNDLIKYDPEKRTKPTFYGYISNGLIPYHKRGKKLIFLKSEIDNWLRKGRKKTVSEIEAEAENYLSNHKKRANNGR